MRNTMEDFAEVVAWCAAHKVEINLEQVDPEHFMLTAVFGPISSEALFTTPDTFLPAFYFATSSVKAGFEFHLKHGFVPKVEQ
jgi:predicted RNA-binding protein